jgi:hypothetical protein
MPALPPQALLGVGAQIASHVAVAIQEAGVGAEFQVNGVPNTDQSLLNLVGSGVSYGPGPGEVLITSANDGLAHGSSPWETDPSSVIMVDDFLSGTTTTGSVGQLGWSFVNAGSGNLGFTAFQPPYTGILTLASGVSADNGFVFSPTPQPVSSGSPLGFPITYATGWEVQYVFRWPPFIANAVNTTYTKSRLYLGFAYHSVTNTAKRPAKFVGLRYDTDPGATFTLTAAGNASSGTTAYTGTFTGGGSNAFQGYKFTVAGFTNAANNGTFICNGSSTTSLDLLNASGVSESHAATATSLALSDTTYHFEAVQNGIDGNNVQGATYNTGVSPDSNWHSFRMRSIVQGQILFSFDGGTEQMLSMSTDAYPTYGVGSNALIVEVFGNYSSVVGNVNVLPSNQVYYANPCPGTPATLSGCTGGVAIFNGTWPVSDWSQTLSDAQIFLATTVNSTNNSSNSGRNVDLV